MGGSGVFVVPKQMFWVTNAPCSFFLFFCFLFFGASANPSEIQGAVEEEGAGSTDDTRPPNVTCAL